MTEEGGRRTEKMTFRLQNMIIVDDGYDTKRPIVYYFKTPIINEMWNKILIVIVNNRHNMETNFLRF